eukprot:2608366-Pleurochrysis_carterae.AAC.1
MPLIQTPTHLAPLNETERRVKISERSDKNTEIQDETFLGVAFKGGCRCAPRCKRCQSRMRVSACASCAFECSSSAAMRACAAAARLLSASSCGGKAGIRDSLGRGGENGGTREARALAGGTLERDERSGGTREGREEAAARVKGREEAVAL